MRTILFMLTIAFSLNGMHCEKQPCNRWVSLSDQPEFLPGINYAWKTYGGDFGGIRKWKRFSVSENPNPYIQDFARMETTGSRIVRWWMFPDLRGDGIRIQDGTVRPGKTLFQDVQKALEIADQHNLYLVLCLFSFEAFASERMDGGIRIRNLEDILNNAVLRLSLLQNVIGPLARTVQESPYAHRLLAWDLINEPEWSVKGQNRYGDPPYYPLDSVRPVEHEFMEAFLMDLAHTIRQQGDARITVGQVAPRYRNAWSKVGLDFYQWHLYSWMEERDIYHSQAPVKEFCAPVVLGEIPMGPLKPKHEVDASLSEKEGFRRMIQEMEENGWAGAWVWSYQGRVPRNASLDILPGAFQRPEAEKN